MNTPIRQIEGQRSKVGIENFGLRELSERPFACLVPEPVTDTGLQPTCTALPLGRAGQGNRFGEQPGHAALMSETPWINQRAPLIGENTDEILEGLLGIKEEERTELRNKGVIQ